MRPIQNSSTKGALPRQDAQFTARLALPRSALVLVAAGVLLTGCTTGPSKNSTPDFARGLDSPTEPFSPVEVAGIADCAALTLTDQPGEGATGVELPCLTGGDSVVVDNLGGRLTVVNLWASWCSVCRKEMPVLEAAARRYRGRVQFVGVDSLDEPRAAAAFLQPTGVRYPQLYDQQGDLLKYTRVPGLPVTLLLDETGAEIRRHVGELNAEELEELVGRA